jgi:hypothetical protein
MVWASGSGQATFNLNINNGSADPNLGFQRGLPTESHQHPQHHQHEHVFLPKSPMSSGRKSPSQRRRDCLRAAHHQDLGSAAADICHMIIYIVRKKFISFYILVITIVMSNHLLRVFVFSE